MCDIKKLFVLHLSTSTLQMKVPKTWFQKSLLADLSPFLKVFISLFFERERRVCEQGEGQKEKENLKWAPW